MPFRDPRRESRPEAALPAEPRALRVMLVEDGVPGGVARAVDYLATAWREAGVAAPTGAPAVERLTLRGPGGLAGSVPIYARALLSFAGAVGRGEVDLFHLNLTQRGSTWRALPLAALASAARIPFVIHLHSSQYDAFLRSLPGPLRSLVGWLFRRAGRVFVLGAGWAEFVQRDLHVDPVRIEVLPNAVPGPARLPARRTAGPTRLLFLGRLGARKGVPDLLDALARPELRALPWAATLAGDGDRAAFEAEARRLGIGERIHFTGWVDGAGVRRCLEEADLLVLPSHAEGLPLAVLEGFAHGLAVVTTPVGAVPEVVLDGENGLLVTPGDVPALAAAIHRLLQAPELRVALGLAGRETWERDHTPARHARRILEVYAELTGGR